MLSASKNTGQQYTRELSPLMEQEHRGCFDFGFVTMGLSEKINFIIKGFFEKI